MDTLSVDPCTTEHLELLAILNKQLIEDEQHDNPMNVEQLRIRMDGFLTGGYQAYLFKANDRIKGYALVDHQKQPLYLRQFFICRDCRREGLGRMAFAKLLETLNTDSIEIDVLHLNQRGVAFWKSLGFVERSIRMRRGST